MAEYECFSYMIYLPGFGSAGFLKLEAMEKLKVVKVENESIVFDNGFTLASNHDQDCCENHWLSFKNLTIKDFEGLEFDLSGETFFRRVPDFGIELIPLRGWPVRVPGYGSNNGCYSDQLDLVLIDKDGRELKTFDITECQEISD